MPGRVSGLSNYNIIYCGLVQNISKGTMMLRAQLRFSIFSCSLKNKNYLPPWFMGKCDTGKDNNRLMLTLSLQTYTDHACTDCCMLLVIVSFQIFKFMLSIVECFMKGSRIE